MSRYYLTEPVNSKLVVPSIRGFRNSISIEDQRVSRVEPMASSGIYSVGKQAQRHGFGFEIRFHSTRSNQNGRVMAGVHVLEFTIRGQNAKENGRIALHFRMLADEAFGMLKNGLKFLGSKACWIPRAIASSCFIRSRSSSRCISRAPVNAPAAWTARVPRLCLLCWNCSGSATGLTKAAMADTPCLEYGPSR